PFRLIVRPVLATKSKVFVPTFETMLLGRLDGPVTVGAILAAAVGDMVIDPVVPIALVAPMFTRPELMVELPIVLASDNVTVPVPSLVKVPVPMFIAVVDTAMVPAPPM